MPAGTSLVAIYGDATEIVEALGAVELHNSRVAVAAMPADPPYPFRLWVTDPAAAAIEHLRAVEVTATEAERQRRTLVWVFPLATTVAQVAARAASIQALRGIVQSLTLEKTRVWGPINGVAGDSDDLASAEAVLRFLDDPAGGFTAGSTFDLTRPAAVRP